MWALKSFGVLLPTEHSPSPSPSPPLSPSPSSPSPPPSPLSPILSPPSRPLSPRDERSIESPREFFRTHWDSVECGGAGNCMFLSIDKGRQNSGVDTHADSRQELVSYISNENVDKVREYNQWMNMDIESIQKTLGKSSYLGDTGCLSVLSYYGPTGFLIVRRDCTLDPRVFITPLSRHFIILHHLGGHWRLVRHKETGRSSWSLPTSTDPDRCSIDLHHIQQWLDTVQIDWRKSSFPVRTSLTLS
jgi:hypothetical protein